MRRIRINIFIGLLLVLQIWSVACFAEAKNNSDQWELAGSDDTYEMYLKPISIWPPDNTVTVNWRLLYKKDSSAKGFLARTVFNCSNNKVRTTYSIEKKDGKFTSKIEDWRTVKEEDIFEAFYKSGCVQILQKVPSAIQKKVNLIEAYRALPVYRLQSYDFNPNASIMSRIKKVPDFLISHLHEKDLRENYLSHMPNKKEMEIIENAIDKLPPLNKKVLKNRVVGIYFVKNLWGSGLADFVLDESGKVYVYLVFDAEILTKNMDEWLTNKDKTCFYNDDNNTKIEIVVDNKLDAFLGVLLHESTHAVDYVAGVTPYMDEGVKKLKGESIKSNDFMNDVWKGFDVPLPVNAYKLRGDISFYGFEGPKIPISKAEELYKGFSETAFSSIYGSKSWGEDIAELITLFHLTQKMNRPYVIRVFKNNKLIYSYEPMNSEKVKARFNKVQGFYN